MVEVIGEAADEVNEVSVVGDEAKEAFELQVFLGDRVMHALGCFLSVFN